MEAERALVLMTLCVLSQREVIGIQSSVEYDPGRPGCVMRSVHDVCFLRI